GQGFLTEAISTKTPRTAIAGRCPSESFMRRGKTTTQRRSWDELGGAKAQRRTASMTFMMLGRALEWFTEICSRSYVCRPPQGIGLLPSIRRARPLIIIALE